MTPTQHAILWVYVAIIAIWPIRYVVLWLVGRRLDILTPSSPGYQDTDAPPLVSAIIPAKDEERTLAQCLRSVCAQSYSNLEIVVVDDRSTDGTAAIARAFAQNDPRVRVLTVDRLPPGWTGKTHALQLAADWAHGEWFWFLDADTRHEPENLRIVLEYARSRGAALASVVPEMRCETFWEHVVQPLASIVLMQSFPLPIVNDDRRRLAFANGQYILIRRSAYFAAGGHLAVRDRFVEDIGLASRVKRLGLPIRVALTRGLGSTRMYNSLGQLVRGWSRILYDALGRSGWRLIAKLLDPLIFSQSGHLAFIVALGMIVAGAGGPFAWWLLGLSILHHVFAWIVLRRVYELSVPGSRYVGFYPIANLVMDWVLIRAIRSCLTGEVSWRGTSYGPATSAARVWQRPPVPEPASKV